jgi:hypothetical protein
MAGVYFDETYLVNTYDLRLRMTVEVDSVYDQNIAMDRMIFFLNNSLENSVFVNSTDNKATEKFKNADMKVCTMPEDPYDQLVCIALLIKLNAIAEGRLTVTEIKLTSRLSDDVSFICELEDDMGPFTEHNWWSEPNTSINDFSSLNRKGKIVKLMKNSNTEWVDNDLVWEDSPKKSRDTTEIIFTPETEK